MNTHTSWFIDLALDGLRNLVRYRVRSLLTMLGVMFGVAAVITMQGIGEGAQQTVLKEIAALGLRNIILDSVQPPAASVQQSSKTHGSRMLRYGVTEVDVRRIRASCPDTTLSVAHLVKATVRSGSRRIDAGVLGVSPDYFGLFDTQLVSGRRLTATDEREAFSVVVVSESVMQEFRASGSSLRNTLRIGGKFFRIVGVLRMPTSGDHRRVYMPYRTARSLFGMTTIRAEAGGVEFTRTEVGQLVVHVADEERVPATAAAIESIIKRDHKAPDVKISVPLDLLRSKQRTQQVFNLVLLSVAAISLLVGGIGIMNIMLAIVTERIPEIGLRRAIGARRRDILFQFLAETVILSGCGGLLGCLLGVVAVPLASYWTGWSGIVTPGSVALSLGVSLIVGLIFGMTPAVRAARMDPVTALRHE